MDLTSWKCQGKLVPHAAFAVGFCANRKETHLPRQFLPSYLPRIFPLLQSSAHSSLLRAQNFCPRAYAPPCGLMGRNSYVSWAANVGDCFHCNAGLRRESQQKLDSVSPSKGTTMNVQKGEEEEEEEEEDEAEKTEMQGSAEISFLGGEAMVPESTISLKIGGVVRLTDVLETLVLLSPFFFWGTAMVAMKPVIPKAGPMFVAAVRLLPAGALLITYATATGRKQPQGTVAWLAIALFSLIDASCFQGFLAEGLQRTSAGLGSVIIDSQPLTVAILSSLFFGEILGIVQVVGLAGGILGLVLLEAPAEVLRNILQSGQITGLEYLWNSTHIETSGPNWTIWNRGEWWMLLAAQSMAVGTVMSRWVCKYTDPVMATGWHMILGGFPLLAISILQQDPAVSGHLQDLQVGDWAALLYTSVAGSAISYGLFFLMAQKGSLTRLSSLTFLTPVFAALFGYVILGEALGGWQLLGGCLTMGSVSLLNVKPNEAKEGDEKLNRKRSD